MPSIQSLPEFTRTDASGTPTVDGAFQVRISDSGRRVLQPAFGDVATVFSQTDPEVATGHEFQIGDLLTRNNAGDGWELADASVSGSIVFAVVNSVSGDNFNVQVEPGIMEWKDHGLAPNAVHYLGTEGKTTTDSSSLLFEQAIFIVIDEDHVQYLHWPPSNASAPEGVFDDTFDNSFN